jgi:hypothetical protein
MTRRSVQAGKAPNVIIKASGSVTVKGHESDRVMAETSDKGEAEGGTAQQSGLLALERRG